VSKLLLHMAFVQFGGRGETRAQGMSREFALPVGFEKIAAHTCGKRRALDQPGDMFVIEAVRADMLSAGLKAPEQWAVCDAGKFEPGLQGDDRAGEIA
jgi:hypothetical protein